MINCLEHPRQEVSAEACMALASLKKRSLDQLIAALQDQTMSKLIRGGAAAALGIMEDQKAYRPLLDASKNDPDSYVKWKADEALKKIPPLEKGILVKFSPSDKPTPLLGKLPGSPSQVEVYSKNLNLRFGEHVLSSSNADITPKSAAPVTQSEKRQSSSPIMRYTFRDIARVAIPGVVNINTEKVSQSQGSFDSIQRFFETPQTTKVTHQGSGFVIDKSGYILTCNHVVEGSSEIQVKFSTGKEYDAKIVGLDASTDIALIKIEPTEALTVLPLGNSDVVDVGEFVMAIGNPFGMGETVTVGIVSFKRRLLENSNNIWVQMIQTDTAINPGNSGGPLLNMDGEVVGVNASILTKGAEQSSGIGFAVPINFIKKILSELREKGKFTRGWIGISVVDITKKLAEIFGLSSTKGAIVTEVVPGSAAEKAGIQPRDIVLGVDGHEIRDKTELIDYASFRKPGTIIHMRILRRAKEILTIDITLDVIPGAK